MSHRLFVSWAAALILITVTVGGVDAQQINHYIEDFTSTEYLQKPLYVAIDSIAGQVSLPDFSMAIDGIDAAYPTSGLASAVVVSGMYAYVADHTAGGLLVLDVGDPEFGITLEGSYNTSGSAWDIAMEGNLVFIADGSEGLRIVDVTNPAAPALVGTYTSGSTVWGIAVDGDLAYVAEGNVGGFTVVDISNPAVPVPIGGYNTSGSAYAVDCDGDYVYVADGTSGLLVIDVSDPSVPALLGSFNTPDLASDVSIAGKIAYVADRNGGLQIIDVSNPSSPAFLGSFVNGLPAHGLCHSLDQVYLAMGTGGLILVDASDPYLPVMVDSVAAYDAHDVCIDGEYAFVADYEGLKMVDIFDPAPLFDMDGVLFNGYIGDVQVRGRNAYYDGTDGFVIFDISDPFNITVEGSIYISFDNNRFDLAGDYAFCAAPDGVRVIDISDPSSPSLVVTYTTVSDPTDIDVAGDFAFISDPSYGLVVIDISDPTAPAKYSRLDLSANGTLRSVCIDGNHAYLAADNNLLVIDISNPLTPVMVGSWSGTYSISHIEIYGDSAFLSERSNDGGFTMLDISNPASPAFVWSEVTPGKVSGVAVERGSVFAFDSEAGAIQYRLVYNSFVEQIDTFPITYGAYAGALAGGQLFLKGGVSFHILQYRQRELAAPRVLVSNKIYDIFENPSRNYVCQVMITPTFNGATPPGDWVVEDPGNYPLPVPVGEWIYAGALEYLRYATELNYVTYGENPVLTQVDIRWLFLAAAIDSVVDVPSDNGGWARIHFSRSGLDSPEHSDFLDGYYIWRRVDDPLLLGQLVPHDAPVTIKDLSEAGGNSAAILEIDRLPSVVDTAKTYVFDGRLFVEGNHEADKAEETMPPGIWEIVGSAPIHQQDQYIHLVPTLGDSSATIPYSVFCLTTERSDGNWYSCWPDSGYSVDNIAPGVPTSLSASYLAGGVTLDWDDAPEADFQYHRVYRATDPGFVPSAANLVKEIAVSAWVDPSANPWNYHYKITTLDHVGNESEAASPTGVTGTDDGAVPVRTVLMDPVPNPFNPFTRLSFEMAASGHVRLNVYDTAGRLVATLMDEHRDAGCHDVIWDGRIMQAECHRLVCTCTGWRPLASARQRGWCWSNDMERLVKP